MAPRGVYSQSYRRRAVVGAAAYACAQRRGERRAFRSSDVDTLRAWYEEVGDGLVEEMAKRFGHQVAGFSTLLEEVDL